MSGTEPVNTPIQPTPAQSTPAQPTTPAIATDGTVATDDRFEAGSALLRLILGAMLIGTDELRDRLKQWEQASRTTQVAHSGIDWAKPQSRTAWFRRAMVGMTFEGETRVRKRFSTMLTRLAQVVDEADLAYTRLAFSLRQTPLDPVRRRFDEVLFRAMASLDRWSDRGWIEEQNGRLMAEQATDSTLNELFDYVAHNPEVRQLIEQQGVDAVGSALDDVRGRTASADQRIERLARNLLHRPVSEQPAKPVNGRDASVHATQ